MVAGKLGDERTKRTSMNGSTMIFGLSLVLVVSFVFQPRLLADLREPHQTLREKNESTFICMEVGSGEGIRRRPSPSEADKCLLYDPPSAYLEVLTQVLIGTPNAGTCVMKNGCTPPHSPFDPLLRQYGEDWPPYGYTMIGRERMDNFRSAIAEVNRNNIPGAIVETGVWRGGAMIMAAAVVQVSGIDRDLYLFDAFDMIKAYGHGTGFLSTREADVTNSFKYFHLHSNRVHMVKGLFRDTMPLWTNRSDSVAVLRVDGNFYDSHQDVMYALYENVPLGGIVIFDDIMSHSAVQKFWADFVNDHGIVETINQIDSHSGWFRKVKKVSIDQSKKKPAQDVNVPAKDANVLNQLDE